MHDLFKDYMFLITRLFDARVKSFITNILMGGGTDKVPFQYYSYRVEFQARGMPHIHGVAWIADWYLTKSGFKNGYLCGIDNNLLSKKEQQKVNDNPICNSLFLKKNIFSFKSILRIYF